MFRQFYSATYWQHTKIKLLTFESKEDEKGPLLLAANAFAHRKNFCMFFKTTFKKFAKGSRL